MSDRIPLQIPAYLNKYTSIQSGGIKIEFCTQENISPELLTGIIKNKDKLGYLFFGVTQIEAADLLNLPKVDKTKYINSKSPSQRLRAVIWLWAEQLKVKQEDFKKFYDEKMEQIINLVKDKLT